MAWFLSFVRSNGLGKFKRLSKLGKIVMNALRQSGGLIGAKPEVVEAGPKTGDRTERENYVALSLMLLAANLAWTRTARTPGHALEVRLDRLSVWQHDQLVLAYLLSSSQLFPREPFFTAIAA